MMLMISCLDLEYPGPRYPALKFVIGRHSKRFCLSQVG